jgi:probable O-glycosylation ligase (exosortase A-associated)
MLLGAFWLVAVCSTVWAAQQPERAWPQLEQFSKIVLMTFVGLVLFRDRRKIRWWLLVIALSIGSIAVGGSIYASGTGFASPLFGPPGSIIGDNNSLGFALAMILPLFAFLLIGTDRAWTRALLLVGFFCTPVAIVATYSRGSFIVLCVILPLVLFLLPRKDLIVAACLAALTVAALTPAQWGSRMATITPAAHRTTSSGVQRKQSWYVAWKLGVDQPLLGAGFRPFTPALYEHYIPGYSDYHDAHNHFLQVIAEHGFTGLILFSALLASVMVRMWRTAGATALAPQHTWVRPIALMTFCSLVAYVVGGMFINSPYFELLYQLIAVAVLVDDMARSPVADDAPAGARPIAALIADRICSR